MVIRKGTVFEGVHIADLVPKLDRAVFWRAGSGSLVVEPAGRIPLPRAVLTNRDKLPRPDSDLPDAQSERQFATGSNFPPMVITKLDSAYCLPFGPPMLAEQRKIATDFLIPWSPGMLGWFVHDGGTTYRTEAALDAAQSELELDTAFYLDHSVVGNYGHFIADCLSRIYALEICRVSATSRSSSPIRGTLMVALPALTG